jgi:hypothetical protein
MRRSPRSAHRRAPTPVPLTDFPGHATTVQDRPHGPQRPPSRLGVDQDDFGGHVATTCDAHEGTGARRGLEGATGDDTAAALGERDKTLGVIVVNLDRLLLAYRALMPLLLALSACAAG